MSISEEQRRAEHEARLMDARADRLELLGALTSVAGSIAGAAFGSGQAQESEIARRTGTAGGAIFGSLAEGYRARAARITSTAYDTPRIQPEDPGTGSAGGLPEPMGIVSRFGGWMLVGAIIALAGVTKLLKIW